MILPNFPRPVRPNFSSGPTVKRPGWEWSCLQNAVLGRSHRGALGLSRIQEMLERCRSILEIPADYQIALVPGSGTGAYEMLLWNLLGAKPLDMLAFDVFGKRWADTVLNQLRLPNTRLFESDNGVFPTCEDVNPDHDIMFPWTGTTAGITVSPGPWLSPNRKGLTLVDATAAAFGTRLPWKLLDGVGFSWQKAMGGEAGHGMIVLSPRAIERIESYTPSWPVPKLLCLKAGGKFNASLFEGMTLNTPSLMAVEDFIDSLRWAESIGGLDALIQRSADNFQIIEEWVSKTPWARFVPEDPYRSTTAICVRVGDSPEDELTRPQKIGALLESHDIAHDIVNHFMGPKSLRIWGGPTVNGEDIERLLPWIEWGYMVSLQKI